MTGSSHDSTVSRGLRGWRSHPPRLGFQRLMNPWEFRHLRFSGVTRIAGGGVAAGAGITCLCYAAYGWAAFFLALGALNLAGGSWYLRIDHSAAA